jgi:hypothetical protein
VRPMMWPAASGYEPRAIMCCTPTARWLIVLTLPPPLLLSSQPATGPSALAPAQRAGAQRLRALCWFLDAGNKEAPQAQLAGVQKAPRHEVAGSCAPAVQQALWRFNAGAGLDDGRDADRIRPACLHVREVSGVQEAFRRVFGARQRAMDALMDAVGSRAIVAGV